MIRIYYEKIMHTNVYGKTIQWKETKKLGRNIPKTTRYEILDNQNWRCKFCYTKLKYSEEHSYEMEVAQINHIHPFSEADTYPNGIGNINEIENLQALCPKCNNNKRVIFHIQNDRRIRK